MSAKRAEKPKKKRRRKAQNWSRQAKQLLAMAYLIHGSVNKAARACGIPQRTANSWRERKPEEWDGLMDEARAQRDLFLAKPDKDGTWEELADMIDKVAGLGAAISINELNRIHEKQKTTPDRPVPIPLTEKERDIAARLFGIGIDKAMGVRGIGHRFAAGAGSFEDLKERIAQRVATLLAEDPEAEKKIRKAAAGEPVDGEDETIDLGRLTTYVPRPPDRRN